MDRKPAGAAVVQRAVLDWGAPHFTTHHVKRGSIVCGTYHAVNGGWAAALMHGGSRTCRQWQPGPPSEQPQSRLVIAREVRRPNWQGGETHALRQMRAGGANDPAGQILPRGGRGKSMVVIDQDQGARSVRNQRLGMGYRHNFVVPAMDNNDLFGLLGR